MSSPRFKAGQRIEWPTLAHKRVGTILAILQPNQSVKETLRALSRDADNALVNGLDKLHVLRYLVDTSLPGQRFTLSVPDLKRIDTYGKVAT